MVDPLGVRGTVRAVAAGLAWVLLASIATTGSALAQDGSPAPDASATAEGSPAPASTGSAATTFDPASVALRMDPFVDGLQSPVYITGDGSGSDCLYVVERGGRIRIVRDGSVVPRPFLDISSLVTEGTEQGLHSVAFHPDFGDNGRFFVHYNDREGWSQIAEFRGRPCRTARQRPVRMLLREAQPFPNNNAGWIGFGPDGYLYIPLGDGGGVSPGDPQGIGQSRTSRLSKVLRVDVDVRGGGSAYRIPRDNPYANRRRSIPRETWAMGLRDPRRASFDRETGDLWIGDVGQDRYEEVDRIPNGEAALNFGWSDMEGSACHNLPDCDPAAYEPPVLTYDSVAPQCGVVGGYVYRGTQIPGLQGIYVFSDFCSGFIWGLDAAAVARGEAPPAHLLLDAAQGLASFGEDDAGELYAVSLDGTIYRLGAEST